MSDLDENTHLLLKGAINAFNLCSQPPSTENGTRNGKHEAVLITFSRGEIQQGRSCWSVRLLAQKMLGMVSIWHQQREHALAHIDWRFIRAVVRIKLKHLYPSIT